MSQLVPFYLAGGDPNWTPRSPEEVRELRPRESLRSAGLAVLKRDCGGAQDAEDVEQTCAYVVCMRPFVPRNKGQQFCSSACAHAGRSR